LEQIRDVNDRVDAIPEQINRRWQACGLGGVLSDGQPAADRASTAFLAHPGGRDSRSVNGSATQAGCTRRSARSTRDRKSSRCGST